MIAGTRGGETRGKIISALMKKPQNAHKLSKSLGFDYKTIQHHLKILIENRILTAINKGSYGAVYFISDELKQNIDIFNDIWERFGN